MTNWGYDAAGRLLTDQKQDGEGNVIYGNTYIYDALGNRTSHTDLNGVTTYQYNGLNQLCMVQYPNGNQVTYTYDGNGNRTAKSQGGNILRSYVYDFENHMVQVSGSGGILGTYYYNADGLRVAKVTAAGTVGFVYDDMKLLQEVSSIGQTTATYTSTGGRPESRLLGIANSAGSHVPLTDALGSVRLLLDSSQNASDGYAYEAFGRQVSGGGQTPNPYHFVGAFGYYQDWETGLMLLTRRYYDAEVGGFVTRDPIGFGGGDWNTYGYVRGRVTGRTDALGLQDPVTIVVVVVIVILIGGCASHKPAPNPPPAPAPPRPAPPLPPPTSPHYCQALQDGGYDGCWQVCVSVRNNDAPSRSEVVQCCQTMTSKANPGNIPMPSLPHTVTVPYAELRCADSFCGSLRNATNGRITGCD